VGGDRHGGRTRPKFSSTPVPTLSRRRSVRAKISADGGGGHRERVSRCCRITDEFCRIDFSTRRRPRRHALRRNFGEQLLSHRNCRYAGPYGTTDRCCSTHLTSRSTVQRQPTMHLRQHLFPTSGATTSNILNTDLQTALAVTASLSRTTNSGTAVPQRHNHAQFQPYLEQRNTLTLNAARPSAAPHD